MRVAGVIVALLAIAVALPASAGEEAEPSKPTDDKPEAPAGTEAAEKKAPSWDEWIKANAYDPIRRTWVPIPEGVVPGPETGYIWNLGRWELVKIVHREGYGWGYFDHRGHWHGQTEDRTVYRTVLWKRRDYLNTIPRKTFEEAHVVKAIALEPAGRERIKDLLERKVVAQLLLHDTAAQDDSRDVVRDEPVVSYDWSEGVVSMSGRAELVAKLVTLFTDEATYTALISEQPHGNVVEIISLVDYAWVERDPEPALNIADLNFAGLKRLLDVRSDEYRRLNKALWFNDTTGTATVIDQPETIRKVREYLAVMPYGPKRERMTINGQ
jgi:hypothetical protein